MKTKKILVKMMLMSIATATSFSFASCSDDTIDDKNFNTDDKVITSSENAPLKEAIGLVYKDFITPNDVTILTPDTTEISISKAYADKMGVNDFVNRPMGIWDNKDDASYLRRATEQRLVGDRYILKVVRSNIAEVIGDRDITLNTNIYFNPDAPAKTRSGGMTGKSAKYTDEHNVIHPAAVTFYPQTGSATRGGMQQGVTYTIEDLYYGRATTRGILDDAWEGLKHTCGTIVDGVKNIGKGIEDGLKYLDDKTSSDYDTNDVTFTLLDGNKTFKDSKSIQCGKGKDDKLELKYEVPFNYNIDYTIHLKGRVSLLEIGHNIRVDYMESTFKTKFDLNPQLDLSFTKKLSIPKDKQKMKLADLPIAKVQFFIGNVPVWLDFNANLYLTMNATLEGNAKTGISYKFGTKFTAGCKYDNGWSLIKDGEITNNIIDFTQPAADVEAKAGLGLMLGIDVNIDKVAGPFISVGPQVNADAKWSFKMENGQSKMDFTANAKAGFKGEVGAKLKPFGYKLADWSKTFDIGKESTIFEYPEKK